MSINGGVGYRIKRDSSGIALDISNPFPGDEFAVSSPSPFAVVYRGYYSSTHYYSVVPGVINNLVPQLEESLTSTWVKLDRVTSGVPDPPVTSLSFNSSTHYTYIYLRTGPDATSGAYPSSNTTSARYPRIVSSGTQLSATDTEGYILLAAAYEDPTSHAVTFWQYAFASLWGDRIKVATLTATYYYARV